MYYCCGITEKGSREHNEDAFLIHESVCTEGGVQNVLTEPFLMAVCDGVSGENAGELASRTCLEMLSTLEYNARVNLKRRILDVHTAIAEQSVMQKSTANMQTTLCGLAIDENEGLHCFNVGDSRIYRYRGGSLEQLSRDQTLVQMLYDEGTITVEEKKSHMHRHIVMPVIGNLEAEPKPEVIVFPDGMRTGDVMLLCSDGLSDYATTFEMEEILAKPKPLPSRLQELVVLALANGGKDNITVSALVRYPKEVQVPDMSLMKAET
ncbi:MAG: protein phosphatase 2C domain-containing protein [Oscillospiraceae bacterium]|nr:protein phosphatase 2C domain-containing protein [Oscillospiraceae bacterium]